MTIDPTVKRGNDLPVDNGAWIPDGERGLGPGQQRPAWRRRHAGAQDSVVAGSPAEKAGLQAGDIITAIDGTALDATHPLDLVTSQAAPGQTVKLDVLRDGSTTQLTVVLGTRPAAA